VVLVSGCRRTATFSLRISLRTALAASMLPCTALGHGGAAVTPGSAGDAVALSAGPWRELSWSGDVAVWILLAASLLAYAHGLGPVWQTASSRRKPAHAREALCFAAGWVVLAVALVSPLHALGEVLFSAHMVQHELLMVVAAPLLVLGRPLAVFSRALSAWTLVRLVVFARRLRWPGIVWRQIKRPMAAWALHAATLWIWHVPWLFQATLRSDLVHTAQHASFFGTALLFWWALLRHRTGSADYGAAVLYLFTTSVHSGALGALLVLANRTLYPAYRVTSPAWGLEPLEDQQLGGLLMWIPAGLVYAGAALALLFAWLRDADRHASIAPLAGLVVAFLVAGCDTPRNGRPTVYVSNERDGTISVIDSLEDRVIDVLQVGSRPRGLRLTPDGQQLCVALSRPSDGRPGRDGIACFDVDSHREAAMYDVGSDPEDFAIGHDGRRIYVSNEDVGTASVIDTHGKTTTLRYQVGLEPEGVSASPDGRWVYVTSEASSTVTVLDTATDQIVRTFLVGARPRETAFLPNGKLAFVTAENGASVSVVDTNGHRIAATIDLPPDGERRMKPKGVVCSPDGARLYVATGRGNTVAVVDVGSRRVLDQITVGERPWGIAITPDGRKLYAANGLSNDVSVVDTASGRVVSTIAAGDGPWGVAVRP
jgi:PQQ-dependent catabolism-associated beta-propeller protein